MNIFHFFTWLYIIHICIYFSIYTPNFCLSFCHFHISSDCSLCNFPFSIIDLLGLSGSTRLARWPTPSGWPSGPPVPWISGQARLCAVTYSQRLTVLASCPMDLRLGQVMSGDLPAAVDRLGLLSHGSQVRSGYARWPTPSGWPSGPPVQ